jgi:hypothetical protein
VRVTKAPAVRCKCGRSWVAEWADKCPRCQAEATKHQERSNPRPFTSDLKTTERGYGADWTRAADTLRARAPWCVACLCRERVVVPATVVDHVTPFHAVAESEREGYRLGQWNLQGLCSRHHDRDKRGLEERVHWSEVRQRWVAWLTERVLLPEARNLLGVLGLTLSERDSRSKWEA